MRHELTRADGDRGRQTSRARQAEHDFECRRVLERAARSSKPSIATAKRYLLEAGVDPPLGGGEWHTMQVWRIARRLGIALGTGLRPGVLLYCRKCGAGRRNLSRKSQCKSCEWKARKAEEHRGFRNAELAEAKERLAHYAAKVKALESGARHYLKPQRGKKFGR